SNPTSASDAGTTPQQIATAPAADELPTAKVSPAPEQKADSNTKPPAPADGGETKSATPERRVDSLPTSNPTSASDAGTTPQQIATAPAADELPTAKVSPAPEQKADNNTKPPAPPEAVPPADAETTALASPN